ncbi:hypothetical protein I4I73_10565 [Pseudonocardia sp. KRD-184]|uniref:Uncharacterized protein n=1 Tax=Pseudonocardia oceani TaxID=2792013 RepID=A0ABS6UH66_9PSEU|nr:hypothetical protein [Pseudonocardia oceani]MBW0089424.1 hypothetical protein [Pseudonocardia oceani]MBW0096430.1 hypothetical protein [Pseudonocardia oceani]MBW0108747.1 hypothetical protein [Pseudonocardia oceani]MBW0122975.1 hypothetical protein [Pseudonocardia oceani]MBW0131248.1 hypothetical protein [Pseudonocardia oceani]
MLAAVLVLLATGCGAGQEAATSTQLTHAGGAVGQVGPISVLDVEFRFVPSIAGDEDDAPAGVDGTARTDPVGAHPVVLGFARAGDVVLDVPVDTPDVPRDPAADSR